LVKILKQNWLGLIAIGAMLFVTMGFMFTPHLPYSNNPMVEKACEFAVHGMVGLLVLSLMFFALGRYNLMLVGMACVGALCIFLKGESNNHLVLPENNTAPKMSIAHFNLSYVSENYNEFIERLQKIDADIISLQELTPDWDAFLKQGLEKKYTNILKNVRIDPFGKALFSKKDFLKKDTLNASGNANLKAMLKIGAKKINLISTYILPPLNSTSRDKAISELDNLSLNVHSSIHPTIIIGDLNMVYWSNEIRAFRKNAELENTRRGFTPLGFKIPYDHMFYSKDLECSRFEEIEDADSNHLGILATFQFKTEASEEEIRASVGFLGSK
jgi:endonuclease/exonuclease/phosphatase (EEP) superfamily protein YafD